MAQVVLFHHTGGLTDGIAALARTLRDAGHTVTTPDLFDGRTFDDLHDGIAYVESVGEDEIAARAVRACADLPAGLVYGGVSLGAARAAEQVLARPGARAAFFLSGAVAPSWWGATWPSDVPSQAHVAAHDEFREPDAEADYEAHVPGGRLYVYPAGGHLFAEPGHPDHDPEAARTATGRVLQLLGAS